MSQPDWEDIERRVARLERLMGVDEARESASVSRHPLETAAPPVNLNTLFPIVGRALLGLAGAYLLRAITESASIPRALGVAAGVVYALSWLWWASRAPAKEPVRTAIYGATSALVFCPLLWEAVVHFRALETWIAAGLLALFVILGLGVGWRQKLPAVARIVTLAGLTTAAALLIATHDVAPFTAAFLAMAAAMEISACLEHWLSERWLAALGADLAVWLLTWLVSREHGLPDGYAPIAHGQVLALQIALLGIYFGSTIVRTLVRGLTFTWFETAQCTAAFAIGAGGGMRVAASANAAAIFSLVCALASYGVAFRVLDRGAVHGRNFYSYSTFGILLLAASSRMLLPGVAASVVWAILAVACVAAGGHFSRLTLQVHGGVYLLLALAQSGTLLTASGFVLGSGGRPGEGLAAVAGAAGIAGLCYALAARGPGGGLRTARVLQLTLAGSFVWLLAGLAACALTSAYGAVSGAGGPDAYYATLRTCTLAALAVALAWIGARWNRVELSRLIYPAMILGAYRLAMVDFNQNHKTALFVSLLAYGVALMALPRVARASG